MTRRMQVVALAVAVVIAAVLGWREFYFLTDDAYIVFRYASNAQLGHGYVWNPPPFAPVEGYTCWLWLVLLEQTWRWTGIEPPASAGTLSLLFGLGTLAIAAAAVLRMSLPERLERWRVPLTAAVLFATLTNRTFLAWLSSGLETALFDFTVVWWLYCATAPPARRNPAWTFWLTSAAACSALTRPDGWLFVCASVVLLALPARGRPRPGASHLASALPLLAPVVHLLWRRATYGAWLPNTYYAKHLGAWPESGLRYAASFALEYGLWVWLGMALLWLARSRRIQPAAAIATGAVAARFAYYTLIVGGDHFEYRVYSHLVPLLFISFVWMGARLELSPRALAAALAFFIAASWPIPWTHYAATRDLRTREQTHELVQPIAGYFPPGLRQVARGFDALQAWLIPRHVGMRHAEHAAYWRDVVQTLPPREVGARVGWEDRPVLVAGNVGVVAWVFPNAAIVDFLGLNDWVIARTPPPAGATRMMAHEREPPAGYIECFRPNLLTIADRTPHWSPRDEPLRDQEIRDCEAHFRAQVEEAAS